MLSVSEIRTWYIVALTQSSDADMLAAKDQRVNECNLCVNKVSTNFFKLG